MKRTLRAISVLLMLVMLLSLLPVVALAEGDEEAKEELTRVDKINAMGYNFPAEGDTEIPKYKIIQPDGTEIISYIATDLHDDARDAVSGSTFVILSDLYQSNTYINNLRSLENPENADNNVYVDHSDDQISFGASNGKTLYFDFAGHTIFSEYKINFFSCNGASNLTVYSSEPGARLIMLEEGKDSGGAIITASSGHVTIGDYMDYPGENISTYSAGGFTVASNVTVDVSGITAYRVATDYVAYFAISGHNSVVNYNRVRAFGVGRYLQIATREDNSPGNIYGNVVTFQDCIISNIGSPGVVTGAFFRYMADDNIVRFNNTVFDTVSFTCDRYYDHESYVDKATGAPLRENKTAVVEFDKYCSYNQLPDVNGMADKAESSSKFAMFKFPELAEGNDVPEYILSDGIISNVVAIVFDDAYKAENGIHNFAMQDLLEDYDDLSGMFTLPYAGYENDVIEVTWEYQGTTSQPELWLKGENPTPYTINVPRDTRHIQYKTTKILEDDTMAFYTVTPEVNVTLKMNFTFSDNIYVNVYIPVYDDLEIDEFVYRISVAGVITGINDIKQSAELLEIDGQAYYKVVTPVRYDLITDRIVLTLDVANRSKTGKSFSITKRISFSELMQSYIVSEELEESFSTTMGELAYYIYKKADNTAATIPTLATFVEEHFAERIAEEERLKKEAAEEAARLEEEANKTVIDKLLDKIR